MKKEGYDSVSIEEIHNISILKTGPIVKGLKGLGLIHNN